LRWSRRGENDSCDRQSNHGIDKMIARATDAAFIRRHPDIVLAEVAVRA